ncbi:hypothetical protein Tco_1056358 [Tanacetum coccineum]|uniref:Reverse transcriptase domain-containing protein n=1 Tax=Tanacetum coccineum TaxID=301880 RepID=A0ABQ5H3E5_9ASTR
MSGKGCEYKYGGQRGETGERVGRCGKGRRPREGNDECVDDLNGQGSDQGMGANGGVCENSYFLKMDLRRIRRITSSISRNEKSSRKPSEDPERGDGRMGRHVEQVDEIPHPVTPPRNPTAVPHSSPEQSSESEDSDLANSDEAQIDEPALKSRFGLVMYTICMSESGIKGKEAKRKKLCEVEDKVEKKEEEKVEMKKCVTELERMKECMEEMEGKWELMDLKIIPPMRRLELQGREIARLLCERDDLRSCGRSQAIEDHEKKRASSSNTEGSSSSGGCSHKTFMNGKPHSFNGTEGVVGLTRWMEKMEQVFGTCKCAEQDKVVYACQQNSMVCPHWWKRNVRTYGLENANKIPRTEFKRDEDYQILVCPDTEIQKMEQELWNLTLKGG